jgi:hypothetical protein
MADESLPELGDVPSAAGGLKPFADRERLTSDAATLVDVATVEVCVGKNHRHEEVASDVVARCRVERLRCVLDCAIRPPEVAVAVAEFRRQFRGVEVADPLGALAGLADAELANTPSSATLRRQPVVQSLAYARSARAAPPPPRPTMTSSVSPS